MPLGEDKLHNFKTYHALRLTFLFYLANDKT